MTQEMLDFTATQAGALLGVSESKVRKLSDSGRIESYRIGRRVFFRRASVENYARGQPGAVTEKRYTRRGFLAFGKTFLWAAATAGMSGWGVAVCDKINEGELRPVDVADLLPSWADIQIVPGSHHPVLGYHPDIQIALDRLARIVPRTLPVVGRSVNELPLPDFGRDLILVGGPVSNVLSEQIHGYSFHGDKISPMPFRETGLRWCFHYPHKSDSDPLLRRYVAGEVRPSMPKGVVDLNAHSPLDCPMYPSYDPETERIQSDYLLVTVLPNQFGARSTGATLIDVADLQGQGDKAFACIMEKEELRRELGTRVGRNRYFQALYRVAVHHDDHLRETTPGAIELIDVEVFS